MLAGGNSGRRPPAVSGQRGVLTTAVLSRTGWPHVDRRKGKIVDELDSLDSAEADTRWICLGRRYERERAGSLALFHERAGKQRGAAEMGIMQAR